MLKKTFTALTFAALLAGCSGGVNNNQAAQNANFERIKADLGLNPPKSKSVAAATQRHIWIQANAS
ncbi:MAG: hypothetical protein II956_04420 [Bacteroidales bacterium]|nr:hypothetical protein [Bacteroidales bacterium]